MREITASMQHPNEFLLYDNVKVSEKAGMVHYYYVQTMLSYSSLN